MSSDNTYWNNKGKYSAAVEQLQKLVPSEGSVINPRKNRALEKFRNASNCYYDLYNNGLCNRAGAFRAAFGFGARPYKYTSRFGPKYLPELYERTEQAMDLIIEAAAREQNVELN